MIIIADSGSTKTNWIIADKGKVREKITTPGLNPNFSPSGHISAIVRENIKPRLEKDSRPEIYFYGSGCSDEYLCGKVREAIESITGVAHIEVHSDLLGAARGLLGNKEGIACILGTGSNSCLYDGNKIIGNIPPLGFILGDEGGGAYLGKQLLSDYLKGIMPAGVSQLFGKKYHADKDIVIEKVYRGEFPNKYIASFVVFLRDNISNSYCSKLVEEAFGEFIRRNIKFYERYDSLHISFTGSIAWYFEDILRKVLQSYQLTTGKIIKEPAAKIMEYHLRQ